MTDKERRSYIRKAFQEYQGNKKRLVTLKLEAESKIPGTSGVDYSRPSVVSDKSQNNVENAVLSYIDKHGDGLAKIETIEKKVELVKRTIEHFKIESGAKGKRHYQYICARWIRRLGYHAAAIECEIPESTAGFWIEEIYVVAEAIGKEYNLF